VLARDIPAKGAIDDRQRATVADGAAYFCPIPADGGIDDGQGAAGAVVDASAVAEGAIPASDSIPGDDAVDDRQGAEAVVDAAAVFLSSTIADGHLGKPDLNFGFGANDDDLAVDASAINNRCLRTGTDNLQVEGDEETLVIGRGGDEDDITGKVSEIAFEMVLQACWRDWQSLLSLPFTPSTYHLLLATAVGTAASNVRTATHISFLDFIFPPTRSADRALAEWGLWTYLAGEKVGNGSEKRFPTPAQQGCATTSGLST
jgi:hypothetical protein